MNSELMGKEYNLPDHVIQHLQTKASQCSKDTPGLDRAVNLLQSRKVNYNQLKRILHDMKYIDKTNEAVKYDLYGGEVLEKWGTEVLGGDRGQIDSRKDSRKRADDIGGISGMRKNSHLSSHSKKQKMTSPVNTLKSNSDKTSVSSLSVKGLFEEIDRIKNLMN